MSCEDRGAVVDPGMEESPGADGDLAERVGGLEARVAQAEFERDLARELARRTQAEMRRAEARIGLLDGECAQLRDQLAERDRLLDVVFRSRSFRVAQALRRALGRE